MISHAVPGGAAERFAHSAGPLYSGCLDLGLNSGCCGGVLGIILEALRVPWALFWRLGRCLGLHFGGSVVHVGAFGAPWALPWPPTGPKAKFSQFVPSNFGVILAICLM